MRVAELTRLVTFLLSFLLLLSIGTKLGTWRRSPEYLLATMPGPIALRGFLLLAVVGTEAGTAVLLLTMPETGLVVCAALFAIYTVYLWSAPAGKACNCFGNTFEFGRRKLPRVVRNLVLLSLAVVASIASVRFGISTLSYNAFVGAAVLLLLAYSVDALIRTLRLIRLNRQGATR